jgi:hypothetical protein
MKYLQLFNERLGVNRDVEVFSRYIFSLLNNEGKEKISKKEDFHFTVPIKDIPHLLCVDKTGKKKIDEFVVFINYKERNSMTLMTLRDGDVIARLYLDPVNIVGSTFLATIAHEITHLLQFTKQRNEESCFNINKFKKLYYLSSDVPSAFKNELYEILYSMYLCLEDEISARVSQCYYELNHVKTNKISFLENIKKTYVYKEIKFMDDTFDTTMGKILKNPVKYYKLLKRISDNPTEGTGIRLIDKLHSKLIEIFELPFIKVDEKEAIKTFKDIEKFVHTQRDKFKRKLYKLYDHF